MNENLAKLLFQTIPKITFRVNTIDFTEIYSNDIPDSNFKNIEKQLKEKTEDIEKALKGMLAPVLVETHLGRAQVLQVFSASKFGKVAGCKVIEGELKRGAKVRVYRGSDIVFEGDLSSLRHEKEDVKEIRQGFECGVGFKNFNDILPGDILQCYTVE